MISQDNKLAVSLFSLRLGVFIVMIAWTIDKIFNHEHTAKVFEKFYKIGGLGKEVILVLALLQAGVLIAFLLGLFKRASYGLVLLMHFGSTASAWQNYLHPTQGSNMLFYAAFPMLAACFALYLMREEDTFLTVKLSKA